MKKNIEILSPAGNMKSFIAAVNAGADAIYMGVGKHNARAMAENFTVEEYCSCIEEAHKRDVKVYLTLNTLIKNEEIKEALSLVANLYKKGLDAVILQDLGLALKIHEIFPNLSLHASTQMSVYSIEQVKFLESLGFSRVVLARELSIEEIENICNNTNVEIEVFVHGALCVSVSGQCNMSKLIGERSANRGTCAQPCRMKYSLYKEGENKAVAFNKYILSKKDIWGLDYIERLVNAGVKSLKIEGRNKFPEYVAMSTHVYKKALSKNKEALDEQEKQDLLQIFNRSGKSDGYFSGIKYIESITQDTPKNVGVKLGQVIETNKKYVKVKLENSIYLHDGIEIYSKQGTVSTIVTCIRDKKFNITNTESLKGEVIWLGDINSKCNVGDIIYKTSDNKLNERLNKEYVRCLVRQKEYNITIEIKKDEKVKVVVDSEAVNIEYISDVVPEESVKKALASEDVIKAFSKTDESSVKFKEYSIYLDNNLFLSIANLNEIRRNVVKKIEEGFISNKDISKEIEVINNLEVCGNKAECKTLRNKVNSLYIYSYNSNKNYIKEYYNKYNEKLQRLYIVANDFALYTKDIFTKYSNIELFFAIPNVTLKRLNKYIKDNLEELITSGVKGVLVGNFGYMDLLQDLKKKYNITLGADYSLNITNSLTVSYLQNFGFDFVTLSFELNNDETKELLKGGYTELVENLACAMTSRFCLIGSYVGVKDKVCNRACTQGKFYILDSMNKRYDIVCDNFDCIMRLIRNKDRYPEDIRENTNIRHVWIG